MFAVVYDGKQSKAVPLKSPGEIMIGSQTLQQELRWYLEDYLELPVDTFCTRAAAIQEALSQWGRNCFDALFDGGHAQNWYHEARQNNLRGLLLQVISDDATVLSWPWEALESYDDGFLSLQCCVERRLDGIGDTRPFSKTLPAGRLNMLYIIARPYGDNDVWYQTLARPLIDFVSESGFPVHIDLLRPPTFDRLRTVLEENPNFYHIVHFDGHGDFYPADSLSNAPTGLLVFEDENYRADKITAKMLGELLREYNIPMMVLNACRSGMVGKISFASVALSLLRAGVRSVVAMNYSLWVSGARVFVPAFYQQLFKNGEVAGAMRVGRREMYRNQMRDTFFGQVEFHDWVVPVLYGQDTDGILPELKPGQKRESVLPVEINDIGSYGLIGRDRAIHELERALIRDAPGILIHGMAGEGKTTLAKGFLQWLESNNGLGMGAFWFSFEDIHSAWYVIDTLIGSLFGTDAMALPAEQKLTALTQALRNKQLIIVWDNFESASGIPGTEVSALLTEDDRNLLKQFLRRLRGGKTKILITSRSMEEWFTPQECFRLQLDGLKGEELWQYCNAVVADLGLKLDREDEICRQIMDKLDGNPLVVRAIFLRLAESPATTLLAQLQDDFNGAEGDEGTRRIQATFSVFERGLDRAFSPVLRLIGLHERFVNMYYITVMLNHIGESTDKVKSCFDILVKAGLCRETNWESSYITHPTLRVNLSQRHPANDAEQRVFISFMGEFCHMYGNERLDDQRLVFKAFGINFRNALKMAFKMDMQDHIFELLAGLGIYAYQSRNFIEAKNLYQQYIHAGELFDKLLAQVYGYRQLGLISSESRDFNNAEVFYKKSLDIALNVGNDYEVSTVYHQLGNIATERRDFNTAKGYYEKSLAITLKLGDDYVAAKTYLQLGTVAKNRRDFESAEEYYRKSLELSLKMNNEHEVSTAYHQLGNIAVEHRDFDAAEACYTKSLLITLELGDEYSVARTYNQLGIVAQYQRDFDAAEKWYKKSLEIKLKQNDEYGATSIYHLLATVAQERRDFDTAVKWCNKSIDIKLKMGDEYGAAGTYCVLGTIAYDRQDFDSAESFFKTALGIFIKYNDAHQAKVAKNNLDMLNKKGLGKLPDDNI